MAWQEQAACREADPELFYPEGSERSYTKTVVALFCDRCPVLEPCIEAGMTEDHGIWGGSDERRRRKARKLRDGQDTAGERTS